MRKLDEQNKKCIRGGCLGWRYFRYNNPFGDFPDCDRCGFNIEEAARRKEIPLTLCPDGLRRKLIPKRPVYSHFGDEASTEEEKSDD